MRRKNSTIARLVLRVLDRAFPAGAAFAMERIFLTPRRYRMTAAERPALARMGAEPCRLSDGRRIVVYKGGPESGRRVLLVHGWAGSAAQMAPLAGALAARGYRTIMFDAPAHGASEGSLTGLPEFVDTIAFIREAYGPFHGLIGHSMGGAACLAALAGTGDDVRLVLLAAPDRPASFLAAVGGFLGLSDRTVDLAGLRIERRFGRPLEQFQGAPLMRQRRGETLIVHDRDDRQVPFAAAERLAAANPIGQLAPVTGLGHNRVLSDVAVAAACLGFLDGGSDAKAAEAPTRPAAFAASDD